jgi:hypothetical protein
VCEALRRFLANVHIRPAEVIWGAMSVREVANLLHLSLCMRSRATGNELLLAIVVLVKVNLSLAWRTFKEA